jgi:glutamyl-Q tRNA(Asp) synthetase
MFTRFAPSPTGLLHLGHAMAAQVAWDLAKAAGGSFLLRMEDIDFTRCRPEYETAIFEDLAWLGFSWPQPVWRQSERLPVYDSALQTLRSLGVLYPCFCTRQEIAAATTAPQGETGPVYPGTCRLRSEAEQSDRIANGHPYKPCVSPDRSPGRINLRGSSRWMAPLWATWSWPGRTSPPPIISP